MDVVSTHGLRRHFGAQRAVDGVDIRVPQGTVYAFLGGNGAGKSTTIRLLLGLLRPDAGEVRLFGEPLTPGSRRRLAPRVGSLVEQPSLYDNLSARENLRLNQRLLGCAPSRIDAVLGQVGLRDAADRLAGTYSLGMRQRLGLALALLHAPELLVLDEPTNGLDPAGIRYMRELIRELPRQTGVTVFVSSHLLDEVSRIADHIGILHAGRLRWQGALDALRDRSTLEVGVRDATPLHAFATELGLAFEAADEEGIWRAPGADRAAAVALGERLARAGAGLHHLCLRDDGLEALYFRIAGGTAGEVAA